MRKTQQSILLIVYTSLFVTIQNLGLCDMVYLSTGRTIEGIIEQENRSSLTLNIGLGTVTLPKEDIERIDRYSSEEQEELKKRWSYKYFRREEFTPQRLRGLAADFNELEIKREGAIENKRLKDRTKKDMEELENKIQKLYLELSEVNRLLVAVKPEDDIEKYNDAVQRANAVGAQIKLDEYNKRGLNTRMLTLDRNISAYLNDLRIFKRDFLETIGMLGAQLTDRETYFLTRIQESINDMEKDFTKHTVEYTVDGRSIVVETMLNDLVKARLIVDTGATLVVLSPHIASQLGIVQAKEGALIAATLADGRQVKASPVILKSVTVGGVTVKNVEACVLESTEDTQEDGLLGLSFLKHFVIKIDATNNSLIFEEFNP